MDYNYNVKNDKEKYLMLIPIITLLIILIGGSYAFLEAKDDDNSIAGSNECYTVNYTKGQDISGELNWGTDYTSGKSTDIVMYSDPDCADMTGTLYITTNNTSTMDFSDKAFRYTVVVDNEVVSEGAVDGTANQVIYKDFKLNTNSTTYKVYIWLSIELADTTNGDDESYSGFIHAEAVAKSNLVLGYKKIDNSNANAPGYVEGLIPVMYDESTSRWVKADTTSSTSQYGWYDYDAKKWANAVLVTNTNRGTYKTATAGTPITESDILAYYVWIPRYRYKVWNINKEVGTDTYDAYTKGIDIVFEEDGETTGTITCDSYSYAAPVATKGQPNETCSDIQNGEGYYTHPAFTFGNDELSGFWIGKFELSSTDQTAENYGGEDRIDLTPRILPDVMSWRYNTVGNFWKVIYDMQTTDNIYGLPTDRTTVDSHMLTNIEWGAVAYLTHSKYGRCTGGENSTCTEVAINNSGEDSYYTNYTGRSSGTGGSSDYTAAGTYTYKEAGGQLASTTGNIYGVYDMSGGAYEYVMGNIGTSAGQTTGEYKYYASNAGSNYAYAGFEKYLIPYAYGTTYTDQTAYNRGRLGDATSEVVRSTGGIGGWYGDYAFFPRSSYSWFVRGGSFGISTYAGPFYFSYSSGGSSYYSSARASLVLVAS